MPLLCSCCAPVCSNRVTCGDKKFTHWRKHCNSAKYLCVCVCLCTRATAMFSDLLRPTPFSRIKKSSKSLSTTKNQAICSSIRWSVCFCVKTGIERGVVCHIVLFWRGIVLERDHWIQKQPSRCDSLGKQLECTHVHAYTNAHTTHKYAHIRTQMNTCVHTHIQK